VVDKAFNRAVIRQLHEFHHDHHEPIRYHMWLSKVQLNYIWSWRGYQSFDEID